ncbi:MAG: Ig-like domain-containing protein [Phycisphaerae bacterium]|nr:Ig-like domain-containing protein [Phycisphaerae bacterium]
MRKICHYIMRNSVEVLRANGEVLAESDDATDPHSGIFCADPFLRIQFPVTERVYLRVSGRNGTVGGYHLMGEPESCFDKTGPRIYGVLPDGQSHVKPTSQVFVYFNEEIDERTLNPTNVRLADGVGNAIQGTVRFDPLKCLMRFDAAKPLAPGVYTLRLSGLTDYSGDQLDGETDGRFEYPKVSGDGVPGGDFISTFTVDKIDTEPAPFWLLQAYQDLGNGTWLILQSSGEIAAASINPFNLVIHNDGPDEIFGTRDDHLFPLLCWNHEVLVEHPTVKTEVWVWMMATLPSGNYRCKYDLIDAAGHAVQGSIPFSFSTWPLGQGPRVVRVSPNPDLSLAGPIEQIEVQFSGAMNPATITPETFHVLYSSTGTFFHDDDIPVTDADGIIEYDPVKYSATLKPAHPMGPGFYRVELSGRRGGIEDVDRHLLDGEYLAAGIYKYNDPSLREASPSGNMEEGGDYTAVITVETPQDTVGGHH